MSSISAPWPRDDRSTPARIRDAAITCFAEHGLAGTTVRKVAAAADVSPGLVIHHFGSMDGLRAACDEHVAAAIRDQKTRTLASGASMDIGALLREADAASMSSLARYLARVLAEDADAVAGLVDELVADAEVYLEQGVRAGSIRPTDDPRGRAVVLTIWSLGSLVLHRHLERLLGVDPTDESFNRDPAAAAAYTGPAMQVLSEGVLTHVFAEEARRALAAAGDTDGD